MGSHALNPAFPIIRALALACAIAGPWISPPALAESARFDEASGILQLDCVRLPASADTTYAIELLYNGDNFQVQSNIEIATDATCVNRFDEASNILDATVRVADDAYQLSLSLESDNSFSVVAVEYLGLGETFLYRVSNGTNEVFVGGTIHVLLPTDFPVPPSYTQAYEQSEILVTEISFNESQNVFSILPLLQLPVGEPRLADSLSPETYAALSLFLIQADTSIELYETLHPNWVSSDLFTIKQFQLGYGPGVDAHFQQLALSDGKSNLGLETLVDQAIAINQLGQHLTTDEIVSASLETVNHPDYGSELRRAVTAWREGNVSLLEALTVTPRKDQSQLDHEILLTNRNADWVPQIEEFLGTAEVELVLVGASHLVGDDSVLAMLEELGYLISQY